MHIKAKKGFETFHLSLLLKKGVLPVYEQESVISELELFCFSFLKALNVEILSPFLSL